MELIGNNQEQSGNLPALRNEKDALILRLKLEGKSYAEISAATGVPIKTLQNCLSKGGRLEVAYHELLRQSQAQGKETADIVFEVAKQEARAAIERMVDLSKTAGNEAAFFKANEYLLSLVGISSDTSLRGILQPLTCEQAIDKLDPIFEDLYGRPVNQPFVEMFGGIDKLKEQWTTKRQKSKLKFRELAKNYGIANEEFLNKVEAELIR